MHQEIAKWHLAAAANAIDLGDGDFDESLLRAERAHGDLTALHDYWVLRVKRAIQSERGSHRQQIAQIIQDAKRADADYVQLGRYAFFHLEAQDEFALAVKVYELILSEAQRESPDELNQLSYLRSLAGIELDQALVDINRALEHYPENEALRDTRAWVLFQMGRPLEALEDADFAVQTLEERLAKLADDPIARVARYLEESPVSVDPSSTEPLTAAQAGPILWNEGVLRYHRARILESLGRDDEAQADWSWLEKRRLPRDASLH